MKKKIIFLDIDGVLNSKAYFDSIKEQELIKMKFRQLYWTMISTDQNIENMALKIFWFRQNFL
jgi:histidinol phosphatase-like enzyme